MIHDHEESVTWRTWKRRFLVFFLFVIAIWLTLMPFWQKINVHPMFFLILLYYWALYHQDLLSIEQLVLISLIQDGLYAYPLGFSALRILINYTLLISQKRVLSHQRFPWVWGGFGIFAMCDVIIYASLLSVVKHEWVGILPLIPGLLMTASLYPIVVWLINRFVMSRFST